MKEPIRVLHVVTSMQRGGLETMIMNYYRHIDRSKVQFDFLVHRDFECAYDQEILELGGIIHRLPRLNPFSYHYLKCLDRFFAEHKEYKIVHSHLDCMAGIPLKYAMKNGIPVRIAHAHNSNQDKNIKYPIKLFYKRSIKDYATTLLTCGEAAGKWMFSGETFTVLKNAIDAELFIFDIEQRNKYRQQLGIEEDVFVIGHVGRFAPQKNHKFLLKIFERIYNKDEKSLLVLIGDGELKDEILSDAKKLAIDANVICLGVRDDVNKLMQAMDLFLLPSNYEGLVIAAIEAQAAGLPCLLSDQVPEECKITPDVTFLSLEDSPERWAECAMELRKNVRANRFEEICSAGFNIDTNAKWLQNFYLKLHN